MKNLFIGLFTSAQHPRRSRETIEMSVFIFLEPEYYFLTLAHY